MKIYVADVSHFRKAIDDRDFQRDFNYFSTAFNHFQRHLNLFSTSFQSVLTSFQALFNVILFNIISTPLQCNFNCNFFTIVTNYILRFILLIYHIYTTYISYYTLNASKRYDNSSRKPMKASDKNNCSILF